MNQPAINSLHRILRVLLTLCGAGMLFVLTFTLPVLRDVSPRPEMIAVILVLVFVAGAFVLCRLHPLDVVDLPAMLGVLLLLALLRGSLLYYESGDYIGFLGPWITALRDAPGTTGLSSRLGDYNMPYLYLLFVIAKLGTPDMDLFWVKFVSMMFDVLLAYYAMKLVSLKTQNPRILGMTFLLIFAVPTVFLNSAMWAQCDAIYTAFVLGAVYHALRKNSKLAYVLLGAAFSFKMQTVFIFPLFLIFLLKEKIRFRDAYLFFAVFIGFLLPVLLFGMPLIDALSVYLEQASAYPYLTANAINLYQLVLWVEFANFNLLAIFLTGTAVLALLYFVYLHRQNLTALRDWIHLAFLFAVIIPFFLPRMHDRYFYLADVLSVLVFLYNRKQWYLPLVVIFCSYVTYANFLMGFQQLFSFKHLAVVFLVAILLSLKEFVERLSGRECLTTSITL